MPLRQDESAASPLMVILTVVLIASGVTAFLFFAFVDTAPPSMSVQEVPEASAFRVVAVHGSMDWKGMEVRLVDAAGADLAPQFLKAPDGRVDEGDEIQLLRPLPGGTYLLRVYDGERELARVTYTV